MDNLEKILFNEALSERIRLKFYVKLSCAIRFANFLFAFYLITLSAKDTFFLISAIIEILFLNLAQVIPFFTYSSKEDACRLDYMKQLSNHCNFSSLYNAKKKAVEHLEIDFYDRLLFLDIGFQLRFYCIILWVIMFKEPTISFFKYLF